MSVLIMGVISALILPAPTLIVLDRALTTGTITITSTNTTTKLMTTIVTTTPAAAVVGVVSGALVVVHTVDNIDPGEYKNIYSLFAREFTQEAPQRI